MLSDYPITGRCEKACGNPVYDFWFTMTRVCSFVLRNSPVCLHEFFQVITVHVSVDIFTGPVDSICCASLSSPGLVVHVIYVIISTITRIQALTDEIVTLKRGRSERQKERKLNVTQQWGGWYTKEAREQPRCQSLCGLPCFD